MHTVVTVGTIRRHVVKIEDLLDRGLDHTINYWSVTCIKFGGLPTCRSRRDWCCETIV